MPTAPERIVVAFSGEGSGTGPLAWGQREIWSAICRLRTWMPLGGVRPLAGGTPIEHVIGDLHYAMCRYESLRTRLAFDADGTPTQIVHDRGEIVLEVQDAGDDDPAEVAEEVGRRYRETMLDFSSEWPVRMAVVRQYGALTHLIAYFSHFVTDAAGTRVLLGEIGARDATPVSGRAPLAQARWQASPAGMRQNEAALHYFEGILRAIEPRRFPEPVLTRPRYWRGQFTSTALQLALRSITERSRIEPSAVLLAVFATAVHRVGGVNPVVIRPLASNRFRPGLAGVVCTVTQSGLCAVDVAGLDFDEVLARAARTAMTAYKYAYFEPGDVRELTARVGRERGYELEIGCFLNDKRAFDRIAGSELAATPAQIHAALPTSTYEWLVRQDSPSFEPMILDVEERPDAVALIVHMDATVISPTDCESVLRAMESIAVAAVVDPVLAAQ